MIQSVPKTWEMSDDFDIVFLKNSLIQWFSLNTVIPTEKAVNPKDFRLLCLQFVLTAYGCKQTQ